MPRNSKQSSVPGLFEDEQPDMLEMSFQEAQRERDNLPVECLGMSFPNDSARREHFLGILAEKLKDPEFRQIEGFPMGNDEDILALSDPPYYTACPNPWLGDFLKSYGTPYDPKRPYHREPFAADVSEGKNHPIYNAHSYHTKVPHRAIMRYILHYTDPGDVVFDGFAGTGMTGVAAQLCSDASEIQELGYHLRPGGTVLNEEGNALTTLGARRAILNDLSPGATLISSGLNISADATRYMNAARKLVREVKTELGALYDTKHNGWKVRERKAVAHKAYPRKTEAPGDVEFTLYSDVMSCPECNSQHSYYDIAVDKQEDALKGNQSCPSCHAVLSESDWKPVIETVFDQIIGEPVKRNKLTPVIINYSVGTTRFEKVPDDADSKHYYSAENLAATKGFPAIPLIPGRETQRNVRIGITHLHQFFTPIEHIFAATLLRLIRREDDAELRRLLTLAFTAMLPYASRMRRFRADRKGGGPLSGTLYVSSLITPLNVCKTFLRNAAAISANLVYSNRSKANCTITTQSASQIAQIPNDSVDYIFIDPPFGFNFDYSELNFFWEGFLGVRTAQEKEAIISTSQSKDLASYGCLMKAGFAECFRILKPGRWMTVEFSNTLASVWNSIQNTLQEAGFVVANVAALDKKQLSFKAVVTPTAVKQDLVISAYKPNGGLEARFAEVAGQEQGAWEFVRSHLKYLPIVNENAGNVEFIAERDSRIIFDRMVAFYFQHGVEVPMNSAEFQAGLAQNFDERDGMYFLSEQAFEYERKKQLSKGLGQRPLIIDDERSAIEWLRHYLKQRPSEAGHLTNEFNTQIRGSTWRKGEVLPELRDLLRLNFLCYNGTGDVPNQIHSYISSNYKECRNLTKSDPILQAKAKDCWFVPDPNNAIQLEQIRERELLRAFEIYRLSKERKIKEFRIEALRVGFKKSWQEKDYQTIIDVAAKIPDIVIQEDPKLLMWHSNACTRAGVDQ